MAVSTAETAGRLGRVQGMPLRRWLTTTPGRLRAASIVLVAGLVVVAGVAVSATSSRHDAAEAVGFETVPALVAAENMIGSLADADATASAIYLKAGLEAPPLRKRYHQSLKAAGMHLAEVADASGSSPAARRAVRTITEQLPVYAELVGEARFNSRQGFPVGARYLHDASDLMRTTILPAATTIYVDASRRLDDNFASGTSSTEATLVLLTVGAILVLLVGVQLYVARRTRRVLNVALLGATALVVMLLGGALLQYASSENALVRAQDDGSDTVQLLSAARILTLRASADESFALIERGTGQTFLDDFDEVTRRVAGTDGNGGLLEQAKQVAVAGASAPIEQLQTRFGEFVATHREQVRTPDAAGRYDEAVDVSTGTQVQHVRDLDAAYQESIGDAEVLLSQHAADGRAGFSLLLIAIPLLLLGAAAFVLLGLDRRIAEYR